MIRPVTSADRAVLRELLAEFYDTDAVLHPLPASYHDAALDELRSRSMQVPGGTCGFWGCCGAAVSAGQYYSIISGSTPMTQDPWAATARLTSNIIGRLADVGGPRCCKRTGFAAIEEAARYTAETTGIAMELPERTTCTFMANNAECRKRDCPFFPV